MDRRSFLGACAALLALPAAALTSRSVPRFRVSDGCCIHFTPFGDYDWIDMPSNIVDVFEHAPDMLIIRCLAGDYALTGFPDPGAMAVWRIG